MEDKRTGNCLSIFRQSFLERNYVTPVTRFPSPGKVLLLGLPIFRNPLSTPSLSVGYFVQSALPSSSLFRRRGSPAKQTTIAYYAMLSVTTP